MEALTDRNESLVISYLGLRKAIGVIGISLPFVLVMGKFLLDGSGLLGSISAYYYSIMGDVFVGALCATGVFLLSYRGYERIDDIAGDIGCFLVVGVALFPTAPETGATSVQTMIDYLHFFFAASYFAVLAFFALVLFRKSNPNIPPTPMKIVRNAVYAACGYAIIACLVSIALVKLIDSASINALYPVFWLESIAVVAFGISWFVKGEAILKD